MEDWAGLGTTTVSKQSAQDRYVTEMTVIRYSDRHASPQQAMSVQLMISRAECHDANHYATELPF